MLSLKKKNEHNGLIKTMHYYFWKLKWTSEKNKYINVSVVIKNSKHVWAHPGLT